MVDIIEDWTLLKRYAGYKQGFYQVTEDKKAIGIRVNVGRLGFKRNFENNEDPLLVEILDFCKSKGYIEVSNNIMQEYFFEHIPEGKKEK
jgi:hypothetical protein